MSLGAALGSLPSGAVCSDLDAAGVASLLGPLSMETESERSLCPTIGILRFIMVCFSCHQTLCDQQPPPQTELLSYGLEEE